MSCAIVREGRYTRRDWVVAMSNLLLAVNQLNVPYGHVVEVKEFALALKKGSALGKEIPKRSSSIISTAFVELTPTLIVQCMVEAGADIHSVNTLYQESVSHHNPRSLNWEESVKEFL